MAIGITIEKARELFALAQPGVKVFEDAMLREIDDRGCVIVATAHLEKVLGDLLQRAFRISKHTTGTRSEMKLSKEINKAFDPDSRSALCGSFASKIQLAYLLNLISDDMLDALTRIRKIRNLFAHSPLAATLSDHNIVGLVDTLQKGGLKIITEREDKIVDAIEDKLPPEWAELWSRDRVKFMLTSSFIWLGLTFLRGAI